METTQPRVQAPIKVLALLDNLFFAAKINQAAAAANVKTIFAKTSEQAIKLTHSESPSQIIIDLDAVNCLPLEFIAKLKSDPKIQHIPTTGFVSHVNLGLQQLAREAGCNKVIARSAFDRNLPAILLQTS